MFSVQSPRILDPHIHPSYYRWTPLSAPTWFRSQTHSLLQPYVSCFPLFSQISWISGRQTDVVYTDFKAAFDRLPFELLMAKLERLGIGGRLLSWFKSYLGGRSYRVRVSSCLADSFVVCRLDEKPFPLIQMLFMSSTRPISRWDSF